MLENQINLNEMLSASSNTIVQRRSIFALLALGIIDSLDNGTISATDAIERFFHADNCLFVRAALYERSAETLMSHGVQLPDLFMVLPPQDAQREFQRELFKMRSLCYTMLEEKEELVA